MSSVDGRDFKGVKLIDAADSLRSFPSSDVFKPSVVSRQPVRIVQPPSVAMSSMHSYSYNGQLSLDYNEMLRIAEHQRKLIESNQREIDEREAFRICSTEQHRVRLNALRQEVSHEENELAKLKMLKDETTRICSERINQEKQIRRFKDTVISQEQQLRNAFVKVDALKSQLEVLYRRRLSAANAAAIQQNLVSMQKNDKVPDKHVVFRGSPSRRSSVTPLSVSDVIIESPVNSELRYALSINPIDSRSTILTSPVAQTGIEKIPKTSERKEVIMRPRASVEPFQVNSCKPISDQNDSSVNIKDEYLQPKNDLISEADSSNKTSNERCATRPNQKDSPPPPRDPYPTEVRSYLEDFRVMDCIKSGQSKIEQDHSSSTMSVEASELSIKSRRSANLYHLRDQAKILETEPAPADLLGVDCAQVKDASKFSVMDQVSLRMDTLRAAKRRSWIQQDSVEDETDYIRKILCEEQKKGRTHLLLDSQMETLLSLSANQNREDSSQEVEQLQGENDHVVSASELSPVSNDHEKLSKTFESDKDYSADNELSNVAEKECTSDERISPNSHPISPLELIKKPPEKGILRTIISSQKSSRNVVFDPLALLLDASLEGEMDLIKACAAKVTDLSASNDEGITALHNAICAGHYEIVRFLIESNADVNAQDSDGWTPLHCAASCNNLPMVKILIEYGACIFAQTLSDLETPFDKCEEEEEGFEGCQRYLTAVLDGVGVVNDSCMYAAYGFESVHNDELSFPSGACLKVIEKDADSKFWWLCEYIAENKIIKRGLVPRNYLALYPSLIHRDSSYTPFDMSFSGISQIEETTS